MKNNLKYALVIAGLLAASSCSLMMEEDKLEGGRLDQVIESIRSRTLLDYVEELSSDKYAGRLTGTPEYTQAAEWLASHFEKWGLEPAGDENSYLQSFPNPYTVVFEGGELAYHHDMQDLDNKRYYKYEEEYYPGSNSGDGAITAQLVYAGYGITAPELEYDDYSGVDVEGKIVLLEPGVPVSPEDDPAAYRDWRPYSLHDYKVKMAVAHGAGAMLYNCLAVNPNIAYVKDFFVSQVGQTVMEEAFAGTGRTHDEIIARIKQELKPQSFETGKLFTMENLTEHHPEGTGYNVLGKIPGTDPELKEETIIIGAHLDGAGFCYEIIPGANDNASGTAVMMELARTLSLSPAKPRRSILFIGFGSEEQGLRGSRAYVENPAVPLDKTAAFIHLDMTGCGDKYSVLAAENYPEFWEFILKANQNYIGREFLTRYFTGITPPRLNAEIFLDEEIPALSFSAYGAPTYPHTTRDTAETITPAIMEDLTKILFRSVLDMSRKNSLDFRKED